MEETRRRSIAKAISYRFIALLITILIVFILTGEVVLSMGIGFLDASIKIFAFYFHERIWNKIKFGKIRERYYDGGGI